MTPPRIGIGALIVLAAMLCACLVLAAPVIIAPDSAQEDALITARHARNLAQGDGLVFNPGEQVLGSTSPAAAVLTAWIYRLPLPAPRQVQLLQVVTILLVLATLTVAAHTIGAQRWPTTAAAVAILCLLPDIGYAATAGMDTAFIMLLAAILWRRLTRHDRGLEWDAAAVLCALALPLFRLDAVFLLVALYGSCLIWSALRERGTFNAALRTALGTAAVVAFGVACLLALLWITYGRPLPQSMLAKAGLLAPPEAGAFAGVVLGNLAQLAGTNFPWPVALNWLHLPLLAGLLVVSTMWTILRGSDVPRWLWIVCAATGIYLVTYAGFFTLGRAGVFPWYRHAPALFLYATLVGAALERTGTARWLAVACLILFTCQTALLWRGLLVHPSPNASLRLVGEFLADKHAHTAMLEPIGYVGFYAPRTQILDLGGLTSPDLSAFRRTGAGWFGNAVRRLAPDYVILRRGEVERNEGWNVGALFDSDETATWWQQHYAAVQHVDTGFGDAFVIYGRSPAVQPIPAASLP